MSLLAQQIVEGILAEACETILEAVTPLLVSFTG
jgi:hypothetical protein